MYKALTHLYAYTFEELAPRHGQHHRLYQFLDLLVQPSDVFEYADNWMAARMSMQCRSIGYSEYHSTQF